MKNKPKFKVIELPDMVEKTLEQVKDYLEKTYPNQLAKEEHIEVFLKTKQNPKNWNWFYFFGSVLRDAGGHWLVPCVDWYGAGFSRDADWLDDGWGARYRVVLLETFEKSDSLPVNFDSLDIEIKINGQKYKLTKFS